MERVKKWFIQQRKTSGGSIESLDLRPMQDAQHIAQPQPIQTNYELTAIKIKQLLEKEQFQKVVDTLRELSRDYVLNCLESFPFIALNKAVPRSFLIWETLLTKLHNSEEGYIPQFPYKACDELVMNIAWMLENSTTEDLTHSCKRVLKCVYMQYNEVLEHLYKEHDQVEYALYTLGLHSPLGTNRSAHTIEQAIREEVYACLEDYRTALERLDDFKQDDIISLPEETRKSSPPVGFDKERESFLDVFSVPSPNQVQLQERLYQNQRVFTTLQPSRRAGNLHQLLELLHERIHGDKEVISIFSRIRKKEPSLKDSLPVQPWLRKYQHALDLAIGTLKEIEKDLEITIPRVESPMQLCNDAEELPQIVPSTTTYRPRSRSYELEKVSPFLQHRHSIAPILTLPLATGEQQEKTRSVAPKRNLSVPHSHHRSRSASPQKLLRVNGAGLGVKTESIKSIYSSDSSSNGNGGINMGNENGNSSSVHDLHATSDHTPSLAFMRVQSLKSHNSVQVVAGKRKMGVAILPNSYTNLSSMSMGSMNGVGQSLTGGKKHKKSIQRSVSGELAQQQMSGGGSDTLLLQLEAKNNELIATCKVVQDLRKRERELTDRLSEQAQRHLQDSEKFEDILMGNNRPTLVIQRYKELYSQGRVEALDAIEGVRIELSGQRGRKHSSSFGIQVVLDVLKLCYAEASCSLEELHTQWKETLGISSDKEDRGALRQLESAVALYLRRVSSKHNVAHIIQNMRLQLCLKYSESEVLKKALETEAFCTYMNECAQVCWDLSVQTPPMIIDCSEREFDSDLHSRFYESDCNSANILLYHWPTLLQSNAELISRGVVQT